MSHKRIAKPTKALRVTFTGQMVGVGLSNKQWFEVTFVEYKTNTDEGRYDVFLRDTITATETNAAYGKQVIAIAKRAMSKTEIRHFKNNQ